MASSRKRGSVLYREKTSRATSLEIKEALMRRSFILNMITQGK